MSEKKQDIPRFDFVDSLIVSIISGCLQHGIITAQDDILTIQNAISKELDEFFNNGSFAIVYEDDLLESINIENDHKKYRQAILLATTCIEHLLNEFYGIYYERSGKLSNKKINQSLKANGISEKTGALFEITFGEQFPQDLNQQIAQLKRMRNEFAHYKMKKIPFSEIDHYDDDAKIKDAALAAPDLIFDLRVFFGEMYQKLYPEELQAEVIFEKLKQQIAKETS